MFDCDVIAFVLVTSLRLCVLAFPSNVSACDVIALCHRAVIAFVFVTSLRICVLAVPSNVCVCDVIVRSSPIKSAGLATSSSVKRRSRAISFF